MSAAAGLRALADAATPGPWMGGSYWDEMYGKLKFEVVQDPGDVIVAVRMREEDAMLAALAPELARWAADAAEEFQAALDKADALLARLASLVGEQPDA